jgi:16S rRNA (cytosine1402-N4)-methyltransferase
MKGGADPVATECGKEGHVPVLPGAVVGYLGRPVGDTLVDCTVGLGGHAGILLEGNKNLRIIGLDADLESLEVARERLAGFGSRVRLVHGNFAQAASLVRGLGEGPVGGLLADLGVSSRQLGDPRRGLSFEVDGPLDMRLDPGQATTAADLVNGLPEGELADLLYFQSQERHSRKIAKRICQARRQGRLNSTVMLARLVAAAVGENPDAHRGRIHPATRTFMALRMSVNREVEALRGLLAEAPRLLAPGGRIGVISFHSVEDRIVKEDFKARSAAG